MTDYVKSTNFTSKDSLATGNPLKIVKGAEFDTEFNAIATAVATKADIASPTFTGTPLAPTAAVGTNSTQLATTAFVRGELLSSVYPVGSLYLNATNSTNPATLLGFGTWAAFGAGRMPVGFNAADPLFDSAEETGGSKDAIVVSHTHTATTAITDPGHSHDIVMSSSVNTSNITPSKLSTTENQTGTTESAVTGITAATTVNSTGSSGTNANLPPYITVYMWKRTA